MPIIMARALWERDVMDAVCREDSRPRPVWQGRTLGVAGRDAASHTAPTGYFAGTVRAAKSHQPSSRRSMRA